MRSSQFKIERKSFSISLMEFDRNKDKIELKMFKRMKKKNLFFLFSTNVSKATETRQMKRIWVKMEVREFVVVVVFNPNHIK